MKVSELINILNLKIFAGKDCIDKNIIEGGYVSDLLSDVMGNAKEGNLWITLQTHKNVVAVSSLKDLSAVILVKGFVPDEDSILKADEEGIPLLGSEEETFELVGKIYNIIN